MFQVHGLATHIESNRARSTALLGGFAVLMCVLAFSLTLIGAAMSGGSVEEIVRRAVQNMRWAGPLALVSTAVWFLIAWLGHQKMIAAATGAVDLPKSAAPRLHHQLETMCISRGLTTPRLMIIETSALNAYASGLTREQETITVTRGLIDTLEPAEMEAVLAHELTHLMNKDTQLLVIAIIFTGVFSFFGDLAMRGADFPFGRLPRDSGRSAKGDGKGGGGAAFVIVIALAMIALAWGLAMLSRFALSRSREYMADAGAVELTKNPDALIAALRKIERNATIPEAASRMSAFFIECPLVIKSNDLMATHPPMQERIDALIDYAGGRDMLGPPQSVEPAGWAFPDAEQAASQAPADHAAPFLPQSAPWSQAAAPAPDQSSGPSSGPWGRRAPLFGRRKSPRGNSA